MFNLSNFLGSLQILKAPFRLLWWLTKFILKNALVILTFGILNGWFDKDKD